MNTTSAHAGRLVGAGAHKYTALIALALRLGDLFVLVGAASLAYAYRFGHFDLPIAYQSTVARGVLFALLIFGSSSAYRSWRGMSLSAETTRIAVLWFGVFAAGVALRAVERVATSANPEADRALSDAAAGRTASAATAANPKTAPAYCAGALLATTEQLERILEVALVLLVGAAVMVAGVSLAGIWFALLLFLVIRPMAVYVGLAGEPLTQTHKLLTSWFGIRGIGSMYYLAFALTHGIDDAIAADLVPLTIALVVASIVLHGISVTPLMNRYERKRRASPSLRKDA